MYCNKCGQEIDPNVGHCTNCEQNETFFSEPAPTQTPNSGTQPNAQTPKPEQPGDKKFGFGKALTSTILGVIAYVVMSIATGIALGFLENVVEFDFSDAAYFATIGIVITMVFFVIAGALAIGSIILGIISIRTFIQRKKEGYVKPLPTLILGIIGTAAAAAAFAYGALTLFFVLGLVAYL